MSKKKLSVLIVDDEPNAIETLSDDLSSYPDIVVNGMFTSAIEAEAAILELQPDVIFLDMVMTDMSGIELLQSVRGVVSAPMHVVFYSGYDRYMVDAIRNSAFDFLLKPYKKEELDAIVRRLRESVPDKLHFEQSMQRLLSEDSKFALQTMTRLLFIRFSEILLFQYINGSRCWQVILTNMSSHRLRMNVKSKDILGMCPHFIRINSSCVLNLEYLSSIENRSLKCILYPPFSHVELYTSRRYLSKIKETLELL